MQLYRQDTSEEIITALEQLEEEMPEFKNILFNWHIALLYECDKSQKLIKFTENHKELLDALPKNQLIYSDSVFLYMSALNDNYQPLKALQIFGEATEQQGFMLSTYLLYQYGYANYLMMNLCGTQFEFEMYKQAAIEVFTLLEQYNYEMPGLIENWLENIH